VGAAMATRMQRCTAQAGAIGPSPPVGALFKGRYFAGPCGRTDSSETHAGGNTLIESGGWVYCDITFVRPGDKGADIIRFFFGPSSPPWPVVG